MACGWSLTYYVGRGMNSNEEVRGVARYVAAWRGVVAWASVGVAGLFEPRSPFPTPSPTPTLTLTDLVDLPGGLQGWRSAVHRRQIAILGMPVLLRNDYDHGRLR
jgi:hypothetical protein